MNEQTPTVAGLLRLTRQHGFDLHETRPDLDESDDDFVVVHAADDAGAPWLVAAPRRADVVTRADAERRVHGLVASKLEVAVPRWSLFTPEVIAGPRLSGQPAAEADPERGNWVWRFDAAEPPGVFLDSLASALASLHAIDPAEAVGANLPDLRPEDIRAATAERIARSRDGLTVPDQLLRRWQDWVGDDTNWPARSVVVHGDLQPDHLLLDAGQKVTGLVGWSEAHVGDPATDFTLLYASTGLDALTSLLGRYTAAGGEVWPRMAHHIVERWHAYPAVIADFARLTEDDQPMLLAQAMVDETVRAMASDV